MGNENSDAQNNQKCGNSFKHPRILRNGFIKTSTFCTVKEVSLSGLNFPPRDDSAQHSTRVKIARHDLSLSLLPANHLVWVQCGWLAFDERFVALDCRLRLDARWRKPLT
jgi:hypothetical protein